MKVCEKNNCYGCYACETICPKKAISMDDNYDGIYPVINQDRCINCKACSKICNKEISLHETIECYSGYSIDHAIHNSSSSGGIAYEISKYIIENQGIVYGVSSYLDSDGDISYIRVDQVKDLVKLQGSKYTHAYIKSAYKNAQNDLKNGKIVLFIGTPCQIAGLKKIVGENDKKLFTIDIVCHGVIPQYLLKMEIKKEFDFVSFRGANGFSLIAKKNNKIIYKKNKYESDYYDLFLNGYAYRINCYSCKYAQKNRIGDITLGDFWGKKDYKEKNGISLILVNTDLGRDLVTKIDSIKIEKEIIETAYINNNQLVKPTTMPIDNLHLLGNIKKYGLKKAKYKNGKVKYEITHIKGKLKRIKDMVK